jgi:hypothetical protein
MSDEGIARTMLECARMLRTKNLQITPGVVASAAVPIGRAP